MYIFQIELDKKDSDNMLCNLFAINNLITQYSRNISEDFIIDRIEYLQSLHILSYFLIQKYIDNKNENFFNTHFLSIEGKKIIMENMKPYFLKIKSKI